MAKINKIVIPSECNERGNLPLSILKTIRKIPTVATLLRDDDVYKRIAEQKISARQYLNF